MCESRCVYSTRDESTDFRTSTEIHTHQAEYCTARVTEERRQEDSDWRRMRRPKDDKRTQSSHERPLQDLYKRVHATSAR